MSNTDWDVIVVGAGIMGLSSAYYVKRNNPRKTVLVIEKERTYAQGNSGRSVAGFRDFFSTDINLKLARASIQFYRHVQNDFGYDLGMKFTGYLFLMSKRKFQSMKPIIENLKNRTNIEIIDMERLKNISSLKFDLKDEESRALSLEPIEVGVMGKNCGILDIEKLASYYYEACKDMGVEFRFGEEIKDLTISPKAPIGYPGEPFLWQDKIVSGVITESQELRAREFVFTMGAWTGSILDKIGVDSHMRPKRRFVYQIGGDGIRDIIHDSFGLNEESVFPFTILPSHGIYLRPYPQNGSFWVSTSGTTSDKEIGKTFAYEAMDKMEYVQPDEEYFSYNILPVLRAYLKNFDNVKVTSSWSGYYSLNTQDKTPYIFRFLNAIVATGGSGAGLMKSDSIGRIVSSLLSGNETTELFDHSKVRNASLGVSDRDVGIESLRF
ncbi:MAG: NAD(P)/FAD-dependent oxidoreductase [Thermoplasmata archaeon]